MKIYKESVSAPEISWAIVDIIITCIFMLTTLFIGGLAVYACMTLMNDFCLIFVWVGIIVNMLCFIAKSVTVANIVAKKYKKTQGDLPPCPDSDNDDNSEDSSSSSSSSTPSFKSSSS